MINLNYEYRIYPEAQQEEQMLLWLDICRRVYNYALAERKDWIKSRKSPANSCSLVKEYIIPPDQPYPNFYYQKRVLAAAKKEYLELKIPSSQALQEVIAQVDGAFTAMKKRGFGFPRFKKKMRSFLFPQFTNNPITGWQIKLPKIGSVIINLHRPIPEGFVVKQVRIVKKAWLMVCSLLYSI